MSEVQHSFRWNLNFVPYTRWTNTCMRQIWCKKHYINPISFHVESCLSNNWLWLWISKMSEFSEQQHFIYRSKWQDRSNVLYISFLISFSGRFPFSVKLWTICFWIVPEASRMVGDTSERSSRFTASDH